MHVIGSISLPPLKGAAIWGLAAASADIMPGLTAPLPEAETVG